MRKTALDGTRRHPIRCVPTQIIQRFPRRSVGRNWMLAVCTRLCSGRRWCSSGSVAWVMCSPQSCRQVSASTSCEQHVSSVLRLWSETTYPAQLHLCDGPIEPTPRLLQLGRGSRLICQHDLLLEEVAEAFGFGCNPFADRGGG